MAGARAVIIVVLLIIWVVLAGPLHWLGGRLGFAADAITQRWFCRRLLGVLRIRVVIEGCGKGRARLLVANHISWLDILVLGAVEPLCFLAKREVGEWPLIGTLARRHSTPRDAA